MTLFTSCSLPGEYRPSLVSLEPSPQWPSSATGALPQASPCYTFLHMFLSYSALGEAHVPIPKCSFMGWSSVPGPHVIVHTRGPGQTLGHSY